MDDSTDNLFRRLIEVNQQAERLIGARAWALLRSYGKVMGGPKSGFYVSGLAFDEQLKLVQRLVNGETVQVHLMHRHKSGNYESSALRLSSAGLVMVFSDREERA